MQSVPLCMDYQIDFDPTHRVIRLTVTKPLTDESLTDVYRALSHVAAKGGPYGAILDLSQVEDFSLSADTIKALASTDPAVPVGRPRVVVARTLGAVRTFPHVRVVTGFNGRPTPRCPRIGRSLRLA